MTSHMQGRQNTLARNIIELEACLGSIGKHFGVEWLEDTKGDHPLQNLWNRKDALATNQLVIFGDSLLVMEGVSSTFVASHVKIIKSDAPNNRRGSFFEIIGLRLLHKPPEQQVVPTRPNQPGYDGSLTLHNGLRLDLSLKNYGVSTHELWVRDQCRQLEATFMSCLKAQGRTGVELRAISKEYPRDEDWARLKQHLPNLLSYTPNLGEMAQDGFWGVTFRPVADEFEPLSTVNLSHLVTILSAQHPNEKQNLISKLDQAYSNADKHAIGVGDLSVCRSVMMHLPPTADISACKKWAHEYFESTPNGLIDLIILYQPAVVANGGKSLIMHSIEFVFTPAYIAWMSRGEGKTQPLSFDLPVGVGGLASQTVLQSDTGPQLETTGLWYTYQSGEIWTGFKHGSGSTNIILSNPASGVLRHATVELEMGRETELQGEPLRVCRRLQLLRRWSHDEQDDEQVLA